MDPISTPNLGQRLAGFWRRRSTPARIGLAAGLAGIFFIGVGWVRCGLSGCPDVRQLSGIPARRLDLAQAALLAGLPKGPSLYDPRRNPRPARERRDLILSLMEEQKRITPEEAAAA